MTVHHTDVPDLSVPAFTIERKNIERLAQALTQKKPASFTARWRRFRDAWLLPCGYSEETRNFIDICWELLLEIKGGSEAQAQEEQTGGKMSFIGNGCSAC
jgi:hypothetical protein